MKLRIFLLMAIGTAGMLIAGFIGCNMKDRLIGVYEAVESGGGSTDKIVIELKENSKGRWSRNDEEVPFSWYVKNDELRINTKDGGTIVGKLKRKGITMILPGESEITFKKIR